MVNKQDEVKENIVFKRANKDGRYVVEAFINDKKVGGFKWSSISDRNQPRRETVVRLQRPRKPLKKPVEPPSKDVRPLKRFKKVKPIPKSERRYYTRKAWVTGVEEPDDDSPEDVENHTRKKFFIKFQDEDDFNRQMNIIQKAYQFENADFFFSDFTEEEKASTRFTTPEAELIFDS